jgi:plastocyanin
VTASTLLLALCACASAGELSVTVLAADGRGFADAVVVADPAVPAPRARAALKASMDQRDLMFVPDILAVRTGTAVDFPNSDQVRHQVYSFSGAKTFQLSLYAGSTHPPVVFDKPGLVTLGCNIHDGMIGYVYVTDSPWFGRTDQQGSITLHDVPAGDYTLRVWHSRFNDDAALLQQAITVPGSGTVSASVRLQKPLKAPMHSHGAGKKWQDY